MQNKMLQDCVSSYIFFHYIQNCTGRVQYNGLRAGVSVSQSAVFLLIKMQYEDKTARVERFLVNVEKWVEGRQNLWRVRRFFLFSGEIYPREPISNGMRFTFMSLISVTMWEYFSVFRRFAAWIFGLRRTVSSNTNICSLTTQAYSFKSHKSSLLLPPMLQHNIQLCPLSLLPPLLQKMYSYVMPPSPTPSTATKQSIFIEHLLNLLLHCKNTINSYVKSPLASTSITYKTQYTVM